jgi:hypothetical protein
MPMREHLHGLLDKGEETASLENTHIQLTVVHPGLSPDGYHTSIELNIADNNERRADLYDLSIQIQANISTRVFID